MMMVIIMLACKIILYSNNFVILLLSINQSINLTDFDRSSLMVLFKCSLQESIDRYIGLIEIFGIIHV
jgi:hypothetical protein